MIEILYTVVVISLGAILIAAMWRATRNYYHGYVDIQKGLLDLHIKYGTPITRHCSVCGVEVWFGYDGYVSKGETFCRQHKPKELKDYYQLEE